jgi:hypothetical protein
MDSAATASAADTIRDQTGSSTMVLMLNLNST